MRGLNIRIPAFEPVAIAMADRTIYPSSPPIEVAVVDDNKVKLTVGGMSAIVDGIALNNAINEVLQTARRRRS